MSLIVPAILAAPAEKPETPPPLQGLLVTGGCSHDYVSRAAILTTGIRERLSRRVEWKVQRQGEGESDVRIPLFESSQWALGYDFVVHDYCFPRVKDPAYIERIIAPHEAGLPAVLLHGSLISFQTPDERWARFAGATIRSHDREAAVRVEPVEGASDFLGSFKAWPIPREELYRVEREAPSIRVLTRGFSGSGESFPTTWTNRVGPGNARVFATTLGNATSTLRDPRYLDLVARGLIWSLGENGMTDFVEVSPENSLKGVKVAEAPDTPRLRTGRNEALGGEAGGFFWSGGGRGSPGNVVDGDPMTSWTSAGPGPGSWEVRFDSPRTIGVIAVFWDGAAPPEMKWESLGGAGVWVPVSVAIPESNPMVVSFAPRRTTGLRLSVTRTRKGEGFGLYEIGAYENLEKVPSAIVAAASVRWVQDPPVSPETGPPLEVVRDHRLDLEGRIGDLIPTAAGALFLSLFKDSGPGEVVRVGERGVVLPYLSGIDPGTAIAWDGEWLHTLLGRRLNRVRCALGDGPADERGTGVDLFDWLEPAGKPEPLISQIRLGGDGWYYALAEHPGGGRIRNREGEVSRLPRRGVARFRTDGSGFDICVSIDSRVQDFEVDEAGRIGLLQEREPGRFRDGDEIHELKDEEGALRWRHLAPPGNRPPRVADWNTLDLAALIEVLRHAPRASVRGEAVGEILRRKRDPFARLAAGIPDAGDHENAAAMVAALAGRGGGGVIEWLAAAAADAETPARLPAFLALGDLRAFGVTRSYQALGRVTEPDLSAAILEGLRRSREDLPGVEAVALEMTAHADARLAESAVRYLVSREAFDAALAVFSDRDRRPSWSGAAEVLGRVPTLAHLNRIVAQLRGTRDPEARRLLLQVLCRLHDGFPGETESVLHAALRNPRIEAAVLLEMMLKNEVPLPGIGDLWELRDRNPGLEAFLVGRLRDTGEAVPPRLTGPLREIAGDPDRDEELRVEALLAGFRREPAPDLKEQFDALASLLGTMRQKEIPPSVQVWARQAGFASNAEWVGERVKQKKSGAAELAAILDPAVAAPESSAVPGRELFKSQRCGACHNIHGEGPASAPDLASAAAHLSDQAMRDAIRDPDAEVADGYEMTRFRGADGTPWQGRVEETAGDQIVLLDQAGNRFTLNPADRAEVASGGPQISACGPVSPLDPSELDAIVAFVRTLGLP